MTSMEVQPSSSDHIPTSEQEKLFESILKSEDVFYRHQQRGDPDLTDEEKLSILRDLFGKSPATFITRYHKYIQVEFCPLFDANNYITEHYIKEIQKRGDTKAQKLSKNQRYLQMLKLRDEGSYFSNEKMREREPALFDLMVGQYLDEKEKLHLRPTVERPIESFSHMMQQFEETQQISDRRKRQLTTWTRENYLDDHKDRFYTHVERRLTETDEEFDEEFSDEEEAVKAKAARHVAKMDRTVLMKQLRHGGRQPVPTDPESDEFEVEYDTDDEDRPTKAVRTGPTPTAPPMEAIPDDPARKLDPSEPLQSLSLASSHRDLLEDAFEACEVTVKKPTKPIVNDQESQDVEQDQEETGDVEDLDLSKDILYQEFVAHMEQRFLNGQDEEFYDYSKMEQSKEIDKIRERDLEDAYFDDDDCY